MRTKRTILNFITDFIPMILIALIGIYRINAFVDYLGNDTLGAYQLFGQIFMYLTLAEAGFGTAVLYKLYQPVKDNDTVKINALLSGSKVIFNTIALVIFGIGLFLSFFLRIFIKDLSLNYIYIQISFILNLLANVISYLFITYSIMYNVHQENYKTNIVLQSFSIVRSMLDIYLLRHGVNLVGIMAFGFITSSLNQIVIMLMAKRDYPNINTNEKNKDFSTKKEIRHIIPSKVGSLIVNNIDIIVISRFMGLSHVVVYGVYNYIILLMRQIIQKFSTASLSSIGNLSVSSDRDNYEFFTDFNSTMFFIGTMVCIPLFCMLNPFIHLWVGESLMVNEFTSLFFVIVLLTAIIRIPVNSFIAVYGLFKQTKIADYIEAIMNLSLSIIGVQYFGILGVLVATVVSYLTSDLLRVKGLFNIKFQRSLFTYYMSYIKYLVIMIICGMILYLGVKMLNIKYDNYYEWFFGGGVIFVINICLTFGLYKLFVKEFNLHHRLQMLVKRLKRD